MSSIPFRGPEFRLHLGYPDIILVAGGRTLGRVATEAPDLRAELARMAEAIRRARGRVVVVLPDSEVWRGRLDLAGADRAARRASARIAVAGRLSATPDDIAVVMGPRDAGGSFPVAGVRRSTLIEARALLSAVGLRPSAIIGGGLFPGFVTAPRLGGGWTWPLPTLPPQRRGLAVTAGAGAVVAIAILVLGGPGTPAPEAAAVSAPLPTVVIAEAPAPGAPVVAEPVRTAEVAAPEPPVPALALLRSAPPKPRPAPAPVVTLAARNMPSDLEVVIAPPKPTPAERLVEIGAVPARALGAITAPLRRPAEEKPAVKAAPAPDLEQEARTAMPALPASAATRDLRPLSRPKAAAASAASEAEAPVPARTSETATLTPRPREDGGRSQPAVLVASLEPAPFAEAALAAAAAATVAATLEAPPPARPAAHKAAAAPVAKKEAAPKVVRAQPVSVQPLVKQAVPQRQLVATAPAVQPVAAPVRQKVVAEPVPVRQVTTAPVRVKTVPVKTAPVKTVKAVPVKAAPVKQVAVKPFTVKAAPAKPAPARVAQKPVKQKVAKQQVGLARGSVSLVGVFAGADGRHALVRLPNGNIEKVRAGDRVQGIQIAAVNADSVQVSGRGGRDTLLRLPE